jgi:hypothetical protein
MLSQSQIGLVLKAVAVYIKEGRDVKSKELMVRLQTTDKNRLSLSAPLWKVKKH